MIQKTTLILFRIFLFISIFILGANTSVYAQKLSLKPLDGVEKLCAGPTFNEFYVSFSYEEFPADVTFAVEISDIDGSFSTRFTTAKTLDVIPVSATQQTIKFAVPVDLVGSDVYSFRIKSSTGVVSGKIKNSLGQMSFPAYYKSYERSFSINKKNTTAVICTGGSLTLTVDNDTPGDIGSSPATYPNFKYIWYKNDVVIPGQSSSTLIVNSLGDYYAQVDYGQCIDPNIVSNLVTVSSSSSGSAVTVNSSLGNPFCSNGEGTVLTATSGNSYVWKKDGKVIDGASARTFSTNETGIYTVDVDFGGCVASGTIDLKSTEFTSSINVPETNVISQGETLKATVTTDASNPSFQWYLNNGIINGANSNSYDVTTRGNYKVVVSQSAGCAVDKEFLFTVSYDSDPTTSVTKIANIISLSSYPYDVWDIPSEYKNPQTNVKIISSNGDMVLDVVNYQGDWPPAGSIDIKNVNPVYYYVIKSDTGEKKGSITLIK